MPEYHCNHPGCEATFRTQLGFKRHQMRHDGIYQYHCPYCNKGLHATKNIKDHLCSQHTGLFGFHCNKCRKEFETVHLLKTHLEQTNCF